MEERMKARWSGVEVLDVVILGSRDARLIKPSPAAYRQYTVYSIKEDKTETTY
jgi:hypothetical protein